MDRERYVRCNCPLTHHDCDCSGTVMIGLKVKRTFPGFGTVFGAITRWLPSTKLSAGLWHIQHSDGRWASLFISSIVTVGGLRYSYPA
jgi:hypothetical protein